MEKFQNKGHAIIFYQCQKGQGQKRILKDSPLK